MRVKPTDITVSKVVQSTLVNPTYLVPTIKLSDYEGVGITG